MSSKLNHEGRAFMFHFKFGKGKAIESPYFYKVALEVFGSELEFGVSRKDLSDLKEKGAKFVPGSKKVKHYLDSIRSRVHASRKTKKTETGSKASSDSERKGKARSERERETSTL